MAWYLLLLLFTILSTVECMLNYSRPFNFSYNGTLVTLKGMAVSQNLITFIATEKSYQVMTVSLNPAGSKTATFNLTSAQLLRSSPTNILGSAANDYLTFTTIQVTRYFNNFSSSSVYLLLTSSNESVVEVSYGPTNDEAAVIVKNLTGSYYQLLYLLNGSKLTTKTLPVLISNSFTKSQSYSGGLYLLFEAKLLIYSFDSALTLRKTINLTNSSAARFNVNSSLLVYSSGNVGYVASVANNSYAVVDSLNIGEPIIDLKVASPYLLVSSLTTFYQYDLDIKQTIHTFAHTLNFTGFNFGNHKNSFLVFYQNGNTNIYAYKVDTRALCIGSCPTCPVTYDYNATLLYCQKNFSAVIPVNTTANTTAALLNNSNTTANTTAALLNNSNTTANTTAALLNNSNTTANTTAALLNNSNTTANTTAALLNNSNTTANTTAALLNNSNTTANTTAALLNNSNTTANTTAALLNNSNTTANTTAALLNNSNTTANTTAALLNNSNTTANTTAALLNNSNTTANTTAALLNNSNTTANTTAALLNNSNTTANTTANNTISSQLNVNSSNNIELVFVIIGKTLTFQTTNFLPNFASSLTIFLDDLWYYKFHRYNYTPCIIFFIKRADWLNSFRFSTWFFDIQAQLDKVSIGTDENAFYVQEISPHEHNPENVYFLNSSKEIYLDGIVLNLIIYITSKILHALLFALKKCHPVLNEPYLWIRDNTKWWTFVIMLIESNMMRLAFFATLQFQVFFCYNFVTKLNLVLSTLTLAGLLLYTAVFNLSIFKFQKQSAAKNVLVYTKYGRNSFIFEGFCFTFRNLLRGFLQALLMKSYVHLIIGLTLSDALFLSLCLKFKSRFVNRAIFFSIAFYGLSFFVFDAVLVAHLYYFSWLETRIDYNLMTFVILCVVVGFFILSILILIKETFKFILYIVCGCCRTPKKLEVKGQVRGQTITKPNSKQAQAIVLHKKSLDFEQNHGNNISSMSTDPIQRLILRTKLIKNDTTGRKLKKQIKPKKQIHIRADNQMNLIYIPAQKILKARLKQLQAGKLIKTSFEPSLQEIIK